VVSRPTFVPRKLEQITAAYDAFAAAGFPVTLEGVAETLQVGRDVDRTNWLTVYGICLEGIAAGVGDVPGLIFLQTTSNRRYEMSFNEALAIIRDLRAWGLAAWANWNALKDAARSAENNAALNAIDVNAGYP
jgi:hypothetical protein